MVDYGNNLYKGIGTNENYIEAAKYFKMAADRGNSEAMLKYGNMLKKGIGIPADIKKASTYIKLSADIGYLDAIFVYAQMLEFGDGIETDYKKAEEYYKKASSRGDLESMSYLARMYIDGERPGSLDESEKLLKKAADGGFQIAMVYYGNLLCRKVLSGNYNDIYNEKTLLIAKELYKKALKNGNKKAQEQLEKVQSLLENENVVVCEDFIDNAETYWKFRRQNKIDKSLTNIKIKKIMINDENNIIDITNINSNNNNNSNNINENDNKNDPIKNCINTNNLDMQISNSFENQINHIKINHNQSYLYDKNLFFACLSTFTIPQQIFKVLDGTMRSLKGFQKVTCNIHHQEFPNDIYYFYTFSSSSPFIPMQFIKNLSKTNSLADYLIGEFISNKILLDTFSKILQKYDIQSFMPLNEDFLFFDESILPPNILQILINFLPKMEVITDIKRKVFDGTKIVTYLLSDKKNHQYIIQQIRHILAQENVLFDAFKYPLQNDIIINEKIIFNNKNDFDIILNEIKSKKLTPIHVERNKLFSYGDYPKKNLFQVFSFICFGSEKEKMMALNHINSIVFRGKKNVLQYDLKLHYASINDSLFPKNVRDSIEGIFRSLKGCCDVKRNVCSIESLVDRTYIGFDSMKHLKKAYYKFVYKMNLLRYNQVVIYLSLKLSCAQFQQQIFFDSAFQVCFLMLVMK